MGDRLVNSESGSNLQQYGGTQTAEDGLASADGQRGGLVDSLSQGLAGATLPNRGEHFTNLFWKKKHPTITYCFVFWSFGMCVAFLGPTLLDLGCKTASVFSTMSWVFFAQSLFILLGSACGGFLIQKFTANPVLFVSTVMLAITMAIIPFCNYLALLALVLAIMGFFMGTIDTVANVSMISLYGKAVSPFLQALHFFYGLGAFVSPMIAEPFLLNEDCSRFVSNDTSSETEAEATAEPAQTLEEAQHMTGIDNAFWIMALLQLPVIVLVSTLLGKQIYQMLTGKAPDVNERPKEEYEVMDKGLKLERDGEERTYEGDDEGPQATYAQSLTLTLLTALILFLYDGLQAAYGGYVYSYAVKGKVGMTTTHAAYLNAWFWGSFAFGRLISIAIATKLSPSFMLLCNIMGCVVSMILMVSIHHDYVTLYIGTCLFGVFLSSIYPTAISLAEQYINVTSSLASFIIVGAATGEMLLPVIVGHEFDRVGPLSLMVTGVVISILSIFVYIAIWITGNSILRHRATPGVFGMLTSFISKPAAGEDSGLMTHHVKYYSRMRSDMSESSLGGEGPEDLTEFTLDTTPAPRQ